MNKRLVVAGNFLAFIIKQLFCTITPNVLAPTSQNDQRHYEHQMKDIIYKPDSVKLKWRRANIAANNMYLRVSYVVLRVYPGFEKPTLGVSFSTNLTNAFSPERLQLLNTVLKS